MVGQQIGSYKIERTLGQGGFGIVYVGVDVRLNRRAAIKQLLPELSGNREIVERFFNEAKAAASINHLGIVEIYDVGWHTDGSAYFAMKLLDGDSLAKRIRATGPMPAPMAATITRQVAAALTAAHKAGIVHRDLKPDNIILIPDEEVVIGERAMVLDFGIAKLFGDSPLSQKTRTGMLMGTPLYMSPEQCRGAGEVDHRTDVYALGCILFEMLAGRPPFMGEGAGEILGKHQYVEPPNLASLREGLPPDLVAVVMKSLAKKPEDRQQLMTQLASEIKPFTAGTPSAERSAQLPAVAPSVGVAATVPPTGFTPTPPPVEMTPPIAKVVTSAPEATRPEPPAQEIVTPPAREVATSPPPETVGPIAKVVTPEIVTPSPAKTTISAAGGEVLVGASPAKPKSQLPLILGGLVAVVAVIVVVIASSSSSTVVADAALPTTSSTTELAEAMPPAPDAAVQVPEPTSTYSGYDLDSKDILARAKVFPSVHVKHVLIGWANLADIYKGRLDPRAAKRSNADAAKLAREVLAKLESGGSIDALVKEHSEDPGSLSGTPYKITEKTPFVPEFKNLGRRLRENELGIVRTQYGYHVVKRVPAPPRDPIESADILDRAKKTEYAEVQHVLIGWKESSGPDPRSKARSKPAADKLAKEILGKVRAGEDMAKLMKQYSEDSGSKDTGLAFSISEDGSMVESFIEISLRLDGSEAGIVRTAFGLHVVKRLAPDPLQSNDILARPVAAEKAKVKFIIFNKDTVDLNKLVDATLTRITNRVATFEALIKEVSVTRGDPGTEAIEGARLDPKLGLLGKRLQVNEVGVAVGTNGLYIAKRVE